MTRRDMLNYFRTFSNEVSTTEYLQKQLRKFAQLVYWVYCQEIALMLKLINFYVV